MAKWTKDELEKIASAEELEITSLRSDGTLRKPVIIWVVRIGDDLYVRSVNGRMSAWYQGTLALHKGHITAGGVEKDVAFVDAEPGLNGQIDAAYRAKYRVFPDDVNLIISPGASAATIKLEPR